MQLIIGNKNYSSWSLRSWWLLKSIGAQFNEVMVPLGQPETRNTLLEAVQNLNTDFTCCRMRVYEETIPKRRESSTI